MKKFSKSVFVFIAFALMLGVVLTGIAGCKKPAWKIEAKQAYKNARFAPDLKEVVPGSLLGSDDSVNGISLARASLTSVSDNSISISQTGPAPNYGFETLEDRINNCKSRIDYATELKAKVLAGLDGLKIIGEWQDGARKGFRLDMIDDGTIEYRERNVYDYGLVSDVQLSVRLSADRTTVEIFEGQKTMQGAQDSIYLYNQYSSYDGEAFLYMDSYEFLRKGSSTDFDSKWLNYSEYRKAENGIINSSSVGIGQDIEYGIDGLPTGNTEIKGIRITAFGGNDDIFYSHSRDIAKEGKPAFEQFYITNKESGIDLQFHYNLSETPNYNIVASANLLNIERLYLGEVFTEIELGIGGGKVNYTNYVCAGAELSDGTILYSEGARWGGFITHFPAQNAYTATITISVKSVETDIDSAIAEYGFEFIDAGLDFSSLYNGEASKVLDDVKISRIDAIKDVGINFENALTLFTGMFDFFSEKIA